MPELNIVILSPNEAGATTYLKSLSKSSYIVDHKHVAQGKYMYKFLTKDKLLMTCYLVEFNASEELKKYPFDACFAMWDINKSESYINVLHEVEVFKKMNPNIHVAFVANKIDIYEGPLDDTHFKSNHYIMSALNSENIEKPIFDIIKSIDGSTIVKPEKSISPTIVKHEKSIDGHTFGDELRTFVKEHKKRQWLIDWKSKHLEDIKKACLINAKQGNLQSFVSIDDYFPDDESITSTIAAELKNELGFSSVKVEVIHSDDKNTLLLILDA